MKCNSCGEAISMDEEKCPRCGADLLQFGAASVHEPRERRAHGMKEMVLGELHKESEEIIRTLDTEARKVFKPVEDRLRGFSARHLSDDEAGSYFETEIIPAIEGMSGNRNAEEVLEGVEILIKNSLGVVNYTHYRKRGQDVLKILRAGEITHVLIKEGMENIDLSVKMFPYFKASEIACRLHTAERYKALRNNSVIKELAEWMGMYVDRKSGQWVRDDKVYIDIKVTDKDKRLNKPGIFLNIITGILNQDERDLSGSCRTGIAIFAFGRNGVLNIMRSQDGISESKFFRIDNIIRMKGTHTGKKLLSENLCELQALRNKLIHEDVSSDERLALRSRELSYECLKEIPEHLTI